MVKKMPLFFAFLLILAVAVSAASSVNAQNLIYSVDHQWAQIFINQDGTIDLTYNISLSVTSGTLTWVLCWAAQKRLYDWPSMDQYGNSFNVVDASSGGDYRVDVTIGPPLTGRAISLVYSYNLTLQA